MIKATSTICAAALGMGIALLVIHDAARRGWRSGDGERRARRA
jgi:hypothetical protein